MKQGWFWGGLAALVILGVFFISRSGRKAVLAIVPMFQTEPIAAEVSFPDGAPRAGETSHVHVQVMREGQTFDVYGKFYAIHLVVVSVDQASFLHTVDLQQDEAGTYGADVPFGPAGPYRVWVEVNEAKAEQNHGKDSGLLGYADFQVGGLGGAAGQPRVFGKEARAGPYTVLLEYEGLKAGVESEWRLTVKDTAGKVRQLVAPEPTIYVIVGPKGVADFPMFRHGHTKPAVNGTTVVWRETFPQAGQYLLWTTVYLAGTGQQEALEIPFVLTIGE